MNDILARIQKAVETDDWLELKPDETAALSARLSALEHVAETARDLYERVEMDESAGICLSDRVPSLRLGAALAGLDAKELA